MTWITTNHHKPWHKAPWMILHKIYTGLHFMRVKMRAWTTRLFFIQSSDPTIPCPQGNFSWPKFGPPPPIQIIPVSTITFPTLNIVRHNADKHSCLLRHHCSQFEGLCLHGFLITFVSIRFSQFLFAKICSNFICLDFCAFLIAKVLFGFSFAYVDSFLDASEMIHLLHIYLKFNIK